MNMTEKEQEFPVGPCRLIAELSTVDKLVSRGTSGHGSAAGDDAERH